MRHNTVEVTPFKATYRLYNKTTRRFTGVEFACPVEAVDHLRDTVTRVVYSQPYVSYTLRLEADHTYKAQVARSFTVDEGKFYGEYWYRGPRDIYVTKSAPAAEHCILDNFGKIVTEQDINVARRDRWVSRWDNGWEERERRYALKGVRLTRIKGSADKVKPSCEQVRCPWRVGDYTNRIRGYHRGPQTTNEKRQNCAHVDEYGEGLVRGRRRCLPSNWVDRQVSIRGAEDSWKHHSKRRKQWKLK